MRSRLIGMFAKLQVRRCRFEWWVVDRVLGVAQLSVVTLVETPLVVEIENASGQLKCKLDFNGRVCSAGWINK